MFSPPSAADRAKALVAYGVAYLAFSVGVALFISTVGVVMLFIYRMWQAIQGFPARTTPGLAVGFMFLPFFNIYWIFQVYWGWAKDYNAYTTKSRLFHVRTSEGMALAVCITALASGLAWLIPPLGGAAALVNMGLTVAFMSQVCNDLKMLEVARLNAAGPVEVVPE